MPPKEKLGFYQNVHALAPLAERRGGAAGLAESVLAQRLEQIKVLCAHPKVRAFAAWRVERELSPAASASA